MNTFLHQEQRKLILGTPNFWAMAMERKYFSLVSAVITIISLSYKSMRNSCINLQLQIR